MFMIIKRKQITIISALLLVVFSLVIHFGAKYTDDTSVSTATTDEITNQTGEAVMVSGQANIILEAKNDRELVRSKACELLNKTLSDSNVSDEAKHMAEAQLLSMAKSMDDEVKCESVLAAKGYPESVVFISDSSVNVTVSKTDITTEDVAKINDIIFGLTGNNNIKIVEVK